MLASLALAADDSGGRELGCGDALPYSLGNLAISLEKMVEPCPELMGPSTTAPLASLLSRLPPVRCGCVGFACIW